MAADDEHTVCDRGLLGRPTNQDSANHCQQLRQKMHFACSTADLQSLHGETLKGVKLHTCKIACGFSNIGAQRQSIDHALFQRSVLHSHNGCS